MTNWKCDVCDLVMDDGFAFCLCGTPKSNEFSSIGDRYMKNVMERVDSAISLPHVLVVLVLSYHCPSIQYLLRELVEKGSEVVNCSLNGIDYFPWSLSGLSIVAADPFPALDFHEVFVPLEYFFDWKEMPVIPLSLTFHFDYALIGVTQTKFTEEDYVAHFVSSPSKDLFIQNLSQTRVIRVSGKVIQERHPFCKLVMEQNPYFYGERLETKLVAYVPWESWFWSTKS